MHDFLPDNHPLLIGRSGPLAPRYANFALQNCDFLLSIGSRLGTIITGYNPTSFAPKATKAMVDVDWCEVTASRIPLDFPIIADAADFIREFMHHTDILLLHDWTPWLERIAAWKAEYPLALPTSTYVLSDALSDQLTGDDILISGSSGVSIEIFLLVFRAKAGQRIISSPSLSAMGTIGACIASGKRTILIDGDGSFQLNMQELQTIRRLKLPIKMFVFSNGGYSIIRASQKRAFGRVSGADADSGVTLPADLGRIAEAYELGYYRLENMNALTDKIKIVLDCDGPVLCEVMSPWEEQRQPMITTIQREDGTFASTPLEDLSPFLPRDEFERNMA
jgi:acetolactate synthase-1/2/3 large subunit